MTAEGCSLASFRFGLPHQVAPPHEVRQIIRCNCLLRSSSLQTFQTYHVHQGCMEGVKQLTIVLLTILLKSLASFKAR
jgi:hypothetical protein